MHDDISKDEVIVMQQILASDTGILPTEDLAERNPDMPRDELCDAIDTLTTRDLIERTDDGVSVTEKGQQWLREHNLYDQIGVWSDVYGLLD